MMHRKKIGEPSAWEKIRRSRDSYLLMAPFMLLFLFLTIIPLISAVGLSFTNFNMLELPRFVGWQNYQRMLLDDPIFFIVVKNTFVFAFLTGPLSYVLSFVFAWLINETGRYMRTFLTLVFYMPVLAGNVYFIWAFLFSSDSYGVINGILMSLGVLQEPIEWLINQNTIMAVLIVVQLWMSLGTGFLTFVAGFQGMDRSLFEAGAIDGIRNRWQELFYITIPSMAPQLMFSAVMQIGASFGVSEVIRYLTKDKNGYGPAFCCSLFEDSAEYGYGVTKANEVKRRRLESNVQAAVQSAGVSAELKGCMEKWLASKDDKEACDALFEQMKPLLAKEAAT